MSTVHNDEHRKRLRALGLIDDAQDNDELSRLLRESDTLEAEYGLLIPLVQSYAERVEECAEAKRFLQNAVETAETSDISECRQQVDQALDAHREALLRVRACEQQLSRELKRLPADQRQKAEEMLGSAATRTVRESIDTEIEEMMND